MIKGTAIWHTVHGDIEKIHLVANAGKFLTLDGISFWNCVDVDNDEGWYEVDIPDDEEIEEI